MRRPYCGRFRVLRGHHTRFKWGTQFFSYHSKSTSDQTNEPPVPKIKIKLEVNIKYSGFLDDENYSQAKRKNKNFGPWVRIPFLMYHHRAIRIYLDHLGVTHQPINLVYENSSWFCENDFTWNNISERLL